MDGEGEEKVASSSRERDEMSTVMVATLTRPTAPCPLCKYERCAEDGVSGVERWERGKWWWRRRGLHVGPWF